MCFGRDAAVTLSSQIYFSTLPETNSKFAPENSWLEDEPFLWLIT